MKKLLLLLLLLPALAFGQDISSEWQPFDLPGESLDILMGEVAVNGPRLLKIEYTPQYAQGVLNGCGYTFQTLLGDWAYRSNKPTIVHGSLMHFSYKDQLPYLALRISLTDIEEVEGVLRRKDIPPNYAYLRYTEDSTIRPISTAGEEYSIAEGELGYRNFIYLDPSYEMMNWFLIGDSMTVAFNRIESGTDLEFSFPIMYTEIWNDLGGCFRDLLL
jgi:hypothetical protein